MKILILHGINLNMFGKRNPEHYGSATLTDINTALESLGQILHTTVLTFQTNYEGEMVERIQRTIDEDIDALVINAGAWTHTSIAIHDALEILEIPIVEVHMSNIHAREKFRHHSVISDVVVGSIAGFGIDSYLLGLRAAHSCVLKKNETVLC